MALALQEVMHEVPIKQVAEKYMVTEGLLQYLWINMETFAGRVTVFCGKLDWTLHLAWGPIPLILKGPQRGLEN